MSSEWEMLTLAEAGVSLIDCDHRTPPAAVDGYPYIAIPQLKDGHVDLAGARRISKSDFEDWTRKLRPKEHDVIVVRRCNSGDSAVIPRGLDCAIGQNLVVLRSDGSRIIPQFLRWLIRSDVWWKEVDKYINVGAVFDSLRCRDIPGFILPIPPKPVQKEISETLGALDDRVLLLREVNSSLEAISSAIFKSWFIDFDPVRAKSEGREPEGMSADIAALFPSEFVDSELGPIPKGWTIACLKDHVAVERGLSYKGNGLCGPGEGIPMHNLNSIYEGGGYKYEGLKYYRGEHKERHLVGAGDLIVTNTEQGHEHRLIGFPGVVPSRFPQGLYSHHLYKVVPLSGGTIGREFIYHLLRAPAVRDQVIGCANGSTVNMLKVDGLQIPRFVCPTEGIAMVFEGISSEIRRKVECNFDQSEALIGLRDTLLPRLLSGILSV